MARKESLITAYLFDGKGGGKILNWDEVNAWTPDQGIIWIHLNFTATKSQTWLKKNSGLNHLITASMLADETRPRSLISSEGVLTILRGVNLNPGQDPENMVSIRIWLESNRIITTRRRHLLSVDSMRDALDAGRGPCNPGEFLVFLVDQLTNRMADVISDVDEQADGLEQDVLVAESRKLRPMISDIRRQAILIRRYLAPQREALYRFQIDTTDLLDQTCRMHLREATERTMRYIEDLDSARERASITQEELTSRISEQLDQRMYVLSIVAALFLPVTFLTGLLGVNVGGIPGVDSPYSFTIVCLLTLFIVLCTIWVFHKKKWM